MQVATQTRPVADRRAMAKKPHPQRGIKTVGRMTDVPFKGDRVKQRSGYEYPGFIVAIFTNRGGAVRYVVEAEHAAFSGMLHIFKGDQLELR